MGFELDSFLLSVLIMVFGLIGILNGRRLIWVFVGIGGGALGLILATWLMPDQPEWIYILVMVVLGVASGWASRFNEQISTWVAAFLIGGFVARFLLVDANPESARTTLDFVSIVTGGIIGVALEVIYGSAALIVISSFGGAALMVWPIQSSGAFQAALFAGLAAVGMLLQSSEWIAGNQEDAKAASGPMAGT